VKSSSGIITGGRTIITAPSALSTSISKPAVTKSPLMKVPMLMMKTLVPIKKDFQEERIE